MTGCFFARIGAIALLSFAFNLGVVSHSFAETDEAPIPFDIPSQTLDFSLIAFSYNTCTGIGPCAITIDSNCQ